MHSFQIEAAGSKPESCKERGAPSRQLHTDSTPACATKFSRLHTPSVHAHAHVPCPLSTCRPVRRPAPCVPNQAQDKSAAHAHTHLHGRELIGGRGSRRHQQRHGRAQHAAVPNSEHLKQNLARPWRRHEHYSHVVECGLGRHHLEVARRTVAREQHRAGLQ
eukprot:357241-Chlamydomonas_euryale.AAC.24